MAKYKVDLNCDLGESFGAYTNLMQADRLVLPYISSANIACAFHAGDPLVMQKTVEEAVKNNVSVGAHPGLPDLVGFGRRNMKISAEEAQAVVLYQVGALEAFATAAGTKLHHVKPHGALYNMAAKDLDLAMAICSAVKDIVLVALYGSMHVEAAKKCEIPYVCEIFADRAYNDDGSLVPRSQSGSVITDENEAVFRTVRMIKEGVVATISGKQIAVQADTVCVHGDNPKAFDFIKKMREKFAQENIEVKSF